ncbi:MAG: tRNA (adenosine(37)-N6)-threonylcarbamoyltransferase complex ATPase subunit type 1 TsaE [Saprospiraceae bacterium]|nr:tRNA (adenosine(37)-N6)-threonylcarbamoyltransferase complex ATPase subunit type 1 TsaE [Saprospiraceae bacterium]
MVSDKIYFASDLAEMKKVAEEILFASPDIRVFFMKGNLGAGKTTLIQFFSKFLGSKEQVVSPSFALVNIYNSDKGEIYHLDLYRLNKQEEAVDLGIEDYLYSGSYCFIEWPELIEDIYATPLIEISIKIDENQVRKITVAEK